MVEFAMIDLTDSPEPTPQRAAKKSRLSDHEGVSSSGAAGGSSSSIAGGEGERIRSLVAALVELVPDASPSRLSELAHAQPSGVSLEAAVESALIHWYGEQPAGGGAAGGGEGDDEASLALAQKMQRDEWEGAGGGGQADMVQVSADSALAASLQDEIQREMDGDIARKLQVREIFPILPAPPPPIIPALRRGRKCVMSQADLDHQLAAQVSRQQQQGGAVAARVGQKLPDK